MGVYAPSPGTIYPRLARLEEEGLVTHDEADGRKVYRITDKGREELHARLDDLAELEEEITASVRDIAREVTEDVRETVRSLREELTWAARDFHTKARPPAGDATRTRPSARGRPATRPTASGRGRARRPTARGTGPAIRARHQRDDGRREPGRGRQRAGRRRAGPRRHPSAAGSTSTRAQIATSGASTRGGTGATGNGATGPAGRAGQAARAVARRAAGIRRAYRDLERLARQFSRELRSAAWQAQAVSEDAVARPARHPGRDDRPDQGRGIRGQGCPDRRAAR